MEKTAETAAKLNLNGKNWTPKKFLKWIYKIHHFGANGRMRPAAVATFAGFSVLIQFRLLTTNVSRRFGKSVDKPVDNLSTGTRWGQ